MWPGLVHVRHLLFGLRFICPLIPALVYGIPPELRTLRSTATIPGTPLGALSGMFVPHARGSIWIGATDSNIC